MNTRYGTSHRKRYRHKLVGERLCQNRTGSNRVGKRTGDRPPVETPEETEAPVPKTKPVAETKPEPESEPESEQVFDINTWISFAKSYAQSIGLVLNPEAVDCWDNPTDANARSIYLERDLSGRLNRYAKDEDITDV